MNRQIKFTSTLLLCCFFTLFVSSQNTKITGVENIKNDNSDLKALVVKLLKWHGTDKKADFEVLLKNKNDTIYSGIDWQLHNERVIELEHTNLFTKGFLDNYQKIALLLDRELKENKTKYIVGDLPPYGNEANEWCNCQDYPGNTWKMLKLTGIEIKDNAATFRWTWGHKFFYSVKASKENNTWKIAELERFNLKNFSW